MMMMMMMMMMKQLFCFHILLFNLKQPQKLLISLMSSFLTTGNAHKIYGKRNSIKIGKIQMNNAENVLNHFLLAEELLGLHDLSLTYNADEA